jgi:penicillin-binding protein 1A
MSRRERQRRRRRGRRGTAGRRLVLGLLVIATAGLLAVAGGVGWVLSVAAQAPSIDALKPIDKGAVSSVYAKNGERLGFIENDELRTPVPWNQIPKSLKEATVAVEDARFYQHGGVDYEGVVRAAFENVKEGETVQGGSTITMQLVRNLYISNERTFKRKITEAKLAEQLEDERSKRWILHEYLNTIPYGTVGGQTAIGAEAAARLFFNKPAKKLKLYESALLAGLPQAPSLYNPFTDPGPAKARRDEVLNRMAKQGYISHAVAERMKRKPLGVKKNNYYTEVKEAYFFDYVKNQLIEKYGVNTVRKGGLKIKTTIDLKMQQAARESIKSILPYPDDPSAAIVSIDPKTGYIRAMASSGNYGKSKFNLAAQGRRQPGSAFKTMALVAAIRAGASPTGTTYTSKPLNLSTPYGPWEVKTYAGTYGGKMNLVEATIQSDNTVYAQLALDVGPENVKKTARDLGITSPLEGLPAESLGGLKVGVSPLEMANAYATIENGGWRNKPIAITRVEFPDGKIDDLGAPKRTKVLDDWVTSEVTRILEQNVQRGTGTSAQIGCPAAGKTGTTDNYNDAWFAGFTSNLSTAVWVGYPNAQIEMRNVHGIQVAGGTFPAEIWGSYMGKVATSDCGSFPAPTTTPQYSAFGQGSGYTDNSPDSGYETDDGSSDDGSGYSEGEGYTEGTSGGYDGGSSDGSSSTGGYDPSLYESAPQGNPLAGQ